MIQHLLYQLKGYKFNRQLNMRKSTKSSRNWTSQQDKMLDIIFNANNGDRKLKWEEVAELMHKNIDSCQKTGKQCRERWHNHLAPQLNNSSEWTKQQNETLFAKHGQLGNKWAKIATYLKGRTDNCVKNHFYSTLRRGMRKVNNFIHEQRKQKSSIKEFKPDVLTKILIVADGDPQQKLNAKNNAADLSKSIKELLVRVSLDTDEETYDEQMIDRVIGLVMEFNKNCKKRKGKKKTTDKIIQEKQQQEEIDGDQEASEEANDSSKKEESPAIKSKKQKVQQSHIHQNSKIKHEKQRILKQNKIINTNFFIDSKEKQVQQIDVKVDVKGIDFVSSIVVEGQGTTFPQKTRVNRSQSIESDIPEFMTNGINFPGAGVFSTTKPQQIQPIDLFKSSGIGLSFIPPVDAASKQLLADSAIGIKKAQAFNNLSLYSEKHSFLKLQGDRGVFDPQTLRSGDLKLSGVSSNSMVGSLEKLGARNQK